MTDKTVTVRLPKEVVNEKLNPLIARCKLNNQTSAILGVILNVGIGVINEWLDEGKVKEEDVITLSPEMIEELRKKNPKVTKEKAEALPDMKEAARDPRGFFLYLKHNKAAREEFIKKSRKHLPIDRVTILEKMIDAAKEDIDA